MPYDFPPVRDRHTEIPGAVSGYELAPRTGKGLWSIVSPTGTVTNLNTLGLQVLAYTGAGMPPVENIATPLGVLGGSYLQRTVSRPRTIVLSCIAQGLTFAQVQQIKNKIIAQVVPYNSLQTSKALKLHYQLVNYCGDLIGTALEVAVTYAGDLTGSTDNLYQDRFDLQFVEFAPPGIKELTTIQPSLSYITSRATSTGIRYRNSTGDWKFISTAAPYSVMYDQIGELWYGTVSNVSNRTGTPNQATNAAAYVFAYDQNNNIYIGGAFTSPRSYIMKYNGSTFAAVGATINATVLALAFDNLGNLYAGGLFTAPTGAIGKWDGTTWSALGTGTNNAVTSIVKGLDGNMYVGGSFTTANGVACNYIAMWNGTTFVPLGTGMNTNVNALGVLPDGRIVAAGDFTTAGGVACAHIAVWNGTQWQPLGNGLNAPVYSISVNSTTGEIYAIGTFTASGTVNLTSKFAKWNGSSWVPQDADTTIVTGQYYSSALRNSDSEVAIISSFSGATTLNNGTLNTLTYAGTADVFPQIKFTGPGTLWSITNYATGKTIYFNNYTMLAGETVLYNHDPAGGITFVSSYFGKVLGRILPGSDTTSFSLVPGTNYIVPYVTGGTGATKVELIYQNTHYSFEAGAPA
jgi:hypothetical protein